MDIIGELKAVKVLNPVIFVLSLSIVLLTFSLVFVSNQIDRLCQGRWVSVGSVW